MRSPRLESADATQADKPADAVAWSEFRVPSHLDGLREFNVQLEARLESVQLSAADTFALHLFFDELLTNVIKYAHPEGGEHEIAVRLGLLPEQFEIRIEDDGQPFDPTVAPDIPDSQTSEPVPLEDRTIGGWGLSLVRRSANIFEYRREDGKNQLRLVKRITPRGGADVPFSSNP